MSQYDKTALRRHSVWAECLEERTADVSTDVFHSGIEIGLASRMAWGSSKLMASSVYFLLLRHGDLDFIWMLAEARRYLQIWRIKFCARSIQVGCEVKRAAVSITVFVPATKSSSWVRGIRLSDLAAAPESHL